MRSLLIGAITLVFCATLFAMGKKDSTKTDAEKPLKVEAPKAAAPAVKPVAAEKPATPVTAKQPVPAAVPGEDKVVVTINGVPIKNSTVEARLDDAMKMQMGRMGAGMANLPPDTLKGLRDRMRKDIIDGIVLEQLVDEKLKADKIEVSDQDVEAKINDIMTQNGITMENIQEELAKNGVTLEAFRGQLKRNIGIEKLLDTQMVAAGESTTITDEEAKAFYDENTAQFGSPEQVRASHILIKSDDQMDEAAKAEAKKKAEDILAKARAGEDFAQLAAEHSEDPGSKSRGGEYTFPRGQMVKPFEDAAFGMEPGQISDLVPTQFGYHIIKLSEKIPAKTESFEDVKEAIVQDLTNQKKGRFWMTLREKLRSEAKLEWSAEEKARMEAGAQRPMMPPQAPPVQPK
ncbi:MAG: peptidylprolyl isomerase [Phycisphaerae bacterium]|nr:peptidylprolyl isomerase [Phycisphaerae bacterium]